MKSCSLGLAVCLMLVVLGCKGPERVAGEGPSGVVRTDAAEESSRFISAVGVGASGPDESARLHEADHAARTRLARRLSDYVSETVREFLRLHPNYADPASSASRNFVGAVSTEVSNAFLRQSLGYESWHDTRRRAAYVLYRVPISRVNEKILQKVRYTLGEINPFTRSQEEAALKSLSQFLDTVLKERIKAASSREKERGRGPLEAPPPEWRSVGRHPDYPAARFMTAVGLGPGREEAQNSARAELSRQIEVHVEDRFRSITASPTEDGLSRNIRLVEQETVRFTENDLLATRIAEVWYDPMIDVHYALGVLDRDTAAAVYRERIEEAVQDARELFESARNHHKADNYNTALLEYLQAVLRVQRALRWQLAGMVVRPATAQEFATLTEAVNLREIKGELRELMGEFSLRKVSGDGQWTPTGVALRKPLTVAVFAGEEAAPVGDVPLRFRFVGGGGVLEEALKTREDGTARCTVTKIEPSEEAVGAIECTLAPERLVPDADLTGVVLPSVTFTYVLRTRANTFFALHVDEKTIGGRRAAAPVVQDVVREALTAAGFNLIERSRLPESGAFEDLPGDADAESVLRAISELNKSFKGKGFLIAIVGQVGCNLLEAVDTSVGRLYIVHAPVTLRAIDASLPREPTVLVVNAVGKDAFTDNRHEAARRARVKAANLVSQKLVAALNRKFGPK